MFARVYKCTSVCEFTSVQATDIGNLHGLDAHMVYSFVHSNRHGYLHGLAVYMVYSFVHSNRHGCLHGLDVYMVYSFVHSNRHGCLDAHMVSEVFRKFLRYVCLHCYSLFLTQELAAVTNPVKSTLKPVFNPVESD